MPRAPASRLLNARCEVIAAFGLPQIHGAIMPSSDVAGKDASRAATTGRLQATAPFG
jgi:hypothetical protein